MSNNEGRTFLFRDIDPEFHRRWKMTASAFTMTMQQLALDAIKYYIDLKIREKQEEATKELQKRAENL